jgi:hypothetical protein
MLQEQMATRTKLLLPSFFFRCENWGLWLRALELSVWFIYGRLGSATAVRGFLDLNVVSSVQPHVRGIQDV